MLNDPEEIRIISSATQAGVRDPKRSRGPFKHILHDFLRTRRLRDATLLDLGPGQFDFAELVRPQGAVVHAVDRDPAVLALGRHKGFEVIDMDLAQLDADQLRTRYDGIFCKYSCNAFWFKGEEVELREHIGQIGRLLKPGGWAWIAPWNGGHEHLPEVDVRRLLAAQAEAFRELGCWGVDLSNRQRIRYGVHGHTANNALFCLGLPKPWRLLASRHL